MAKLVTAKHSTNDYRPVLAYDLILLCAVSVVAMGDSHLARACFIKVGWRAILVNGTHSDSVDTGSIAISST